MAPYVWAAPGTCKQVDGCNNCLHWKSGDSALSCVGKTGYEFSWIADPKCYDLETNPKECTVSQWDYDCFRLWNCTNLGIEKNGYLCTVNTVDGKDASCTSDGTVDEDYCQNCTRLSLAGSWGTIKTEICTTP